MNHDPFKSHICEQILPKLKKYHATFKQESVTLGSSGGQLEGVP